ncbi:MAG: hypothetical protein QM809_18695 [Gordonia sp. (in: high G+C Gram-positive bacteria)]
MTKPLVSIAHCVNDLPVTVGFRILVLIELHRKSCYILSFVEPLHLVMSDDWSQFDRVLTDFMFDNPSEPVFNGGNRRSCTGPKGCDYVRACLSVVQVARFYQPTSIFKYEWLLVVVADRVLGMIDRVAGLPQVQEVSAAGNAVSRCAPVLDSANRQELIIR